MVYTTLDYQQLLLDLEDRSSILRIRAHTGK